MVVCQSESTTLLPIPYLPNAYRKTQQEHHVKIIEILPISADASCYNGQLRTAPCNVDAVDEDPAGGRFDHAEQGECQGGLEKRGSFDGWKLVTDATMANCTQLPAMSTPYLPNIVKLT